MQQPMTISIPTQEQLNGAIKKALRVLDILKFNDQAAEAIQALQVAELIISKAQPAPAQVDAVKLLGRLCAFLDESAITAAEDPTPLYAGGLCLQEFGKELCVNDFKGVLREAKALVASQQPAMRILQ